MNNKFNLTSDFKSKINIFVNCFIIISLKLYSSLEHWTIVLRILRYRIKPIKSPTLRSICKVNLVWEIDTTCITKHYVQNLWRRTTGFVHALRQRYLEVLYSGILIIWGSIRHLPWSIKPFLYMYMYVFNCVKPCRYVYLSSYVTRTILKC